MALKFRVGDTIRSSVYRGGVYTITSIDTDRYFLDNSTKYLLFDDENYWESYYEFKARQKFESELEEILK